MVIFNPYVSGGFKILHKLRERIEMHRPNKNPIWKMVLSFKDILGFLKWNLFYEIYNFHLLKKNKAIYFPIQKVACTSLKKAFLGKIYFKHNNKKIPYKNYLTNPVFSRRDLDKYFKFAFVRNPYSRLISCYMDKIVHPKPEETKNEIYKGFTQYGKFNSRMSFKEFVKAVCLIPDHKADIHIRSQYTFITRNGNLIVDYVGKFENLNKDYYGVCKLIGLKKIKRLPHKRKTQRRGQYYDNETKKWVQKRYKKDFELFGYKI